MSATIVYYSQTSQYAEKCYQNKVKNWFIFSNTDYLELIIQFIIVRSGKIAFVAFWVEFMLYTVFGCHSYRFEETNVTNALHSRWNTTLQLQEKTHSPAP